MFHCADAARALRLFVICLTSCFFMVCRPALAQLPAPATNPVPAGDETNGSRNPTLQWTTGADTVSFDVYFGTASSPGVNEFRGNQPAGALNTFATGLLCAQTTYRWRIDARNAAGVTRGPIWSFTTGIDLPADTLIYPVSEAWSMTVSSQDFSCTRPPGQQENYASDSASGTCAQPPSRTVVAQVPQCSARAVQRIEVFPDHIESSGSVRVQQGGLPSCSAGQANTSAGFSVHFDLVEPVYFAMQASLFINEQFVPLYSFRFDGPSVSIEYSNYYPCSPMSGVLMPGRYALSGFGAFGITYGSAHSPQDRFASYSIRLTFVRISDAPPVIQVTHGSREITSCDVYYPDNLGTAVIGHPRLSTFSVRNIGGQPLTLETITVPAGLTVVQAPQSPVQPGGSTEFVVRIDADTIGTVHGILTLPTNDADDNPLRFLVSAQVVGVAQRLYVKPTAPSGGNGLSWGVAVRELQEGLFLAGQYGTVQEIWVAAGTYKPTADPGNVAATFRLLPQVALYGGFVGSETARSQRNPRLHATVLSGDILGDDQPDPFVNRGDNTNNIVTASGAVNAVIDGFIIRDGWTSQQPIRGAGLHHEDSAPLTIANCTFERNDAAQGAGIWSVGSPLIVNCVFRDNRVGPEGGAIALAGPGTSAPQVVNCELSGNYSNQYGGAVHVSGASHPMFVNCTLFANCAEMLYGGGIMLTGSSAISLSNCILWGNRSVAGVGQLAQIDREAGQAISVDHCCIQGWDGTLGGIGNHGVYPRFIDPTGIPNLGCATIANDLHLLANSAAIDAGDNVAVPADSADLDGDGDATEPLPLALDLNPRFHGDPFTPDTGRPDPARPDFPVVDMGAYEFQANSCPADFNNDTFVNSQDFFDFLAAFFALQPAADFNHDTFINSQDFFDFLAAFFAEC